MGKKLNSDEIAGEYSHTVDSLEQLKSELKKQLIKLVEGTGAKLGFPIHGRIKSLDSIIKKNDSNSFSIKKSIKELQDLVGFRIILIFKRDVEKIINLLHENLKIINQYDTQSRLGNNQFGYSSIHIIASIPISWHEVPSFEGLGDFAVEIQIRTLAQHTWAESSHSLYYKNQYDISSNIERSVSRVSALLETVDSEFEKLVDQREDFIRKISNDQINPTNLELILSSNMPKIFRTGSEKYEEVVKILEKKGFTKKLMLENLVKKYLEKAIEYDRGLAEIIIDDNGKNEIITYKEKNYETRNLKNVKKRKAYGNQTFLLSYMLSLYFNENSKSQTLTN